MKTLTVLLTLCASVALANDSLIRPDTQRTDLPNPLGVVHNPSPADYLAAGWRWYDPESVPAVSDGWTRVSGPTWVQDPENPDRAIPSVVDRLTSDIEAEAAALAETQRVARLATFAPLIPLAQAYRATLQSYFGPGAETNRAVTQTAVAGMFLQKYVTQTMSDADDRAQALLNFGFQALSAWAGDSTTWTVPWEEVP